MSCRGWRVALIVVLLALGGCDRSGDAASGASPFRNLGKRADTDLGAARAQPLR
jgi:hypothetical protein